jgi:hypothetical protein
VSGVRYYGHRYYSPNIGRFINKDPKQEGGGTNLYGFVTNNPINQWDVLGKGPGYPTTVNTFGFPIGQGNDIPSWQGFSGGAGWVVASTTVEGGVADGFSASGSVMVGVFVNVTPTYSNGTMTYSGSISGGVFDSTPGAGNSFVYGASAGVGTGLFVTTVGSAQGFLGSSTQYSLNTPVGSVGYSTSPAGTTLSLTVGPSTPDTASISITNMNTNSLMIGSTNTNSNQFDPNSPDATTDPVISPPDGTLNGGGFSSGGGVGGGGGAGGGYGGGSGLGAGMTDPTMWNFLE